MKSGRNDPCPCGSGKKYKKCCLNGSADAGLNKTSSTGVSATDDGPDLRFYSVASMYYTSAALEEGLKPDGLVRMHPYARLKYMGDPRGPASGFLGRFLHFQGMWFPAAVAALSSEEIVDRLGRVNIRWDRESLRAKAGVLGSAWSLAESLLGQAELGSAAKRDFAGLAVCELWRRFCPDQPSIEMVDDWICEGYAHHAAGERERAANVWWKAWEAVRPALDEEDEDLWRAGERLFPRMSQCLGNWASDFLREAGNAVLGNPRMGESVIRLIHEWLEIFPEADDVPNWRADMTRLLYVMGRDSEAEECGRRLVRDYPRDPTGYVALTDEWTRRGELRSDGGLLLRQAIELLESALRLPVDDAAKYDLEGRLRTARQALEKKLGS